MTSRLKKIIIILGILIILALLLLYWFLWRPITSMPSATTTPTAAPTILPSATGPQSAPTPSSTAPATPPAVTETPAQILSRNATRFAMQFAERYGSYSTETNFQNLKDLLPVMTAALQTKTQTTIAAGVPTGGFVGVTTRSITAKITSESTAATAITVTTQRSENKAGVTRVYTQDLELKLVKVADSWQADEATWVAEVK